MISLKEYRIDAKIRNNLILKRIEKTGCKTVGEFCKKYNFSHQSLGKLIAFKEKAILANLEWRPTVLRLAEIFCCSPEELITDEQKHMELQSNKRFIEMGKKELEYSNNNPGYLIENMAPEKLCTEIDSREILEEAFDRLTDRESKIIKMRILDIMLYEEIAKIFDVTITRIRMIEENGMRKLRKFFVENNINFEDYLGMR